MWVPITILDNLSIACPIGHNHHSLINRHRRKLIVPLVLFALNQFQVSVNHQCSQLLTSRYHDSCFRLYIGVLIVPSKLISFRVKFIE